MPFTLRHAATAIPFAVSLAVLYIGFSIVRAGGPQMLLHLMELGVAVLSAMVTCLLVWANLASDELARFREATAGAPAGGYRIPPERRAGYRPEPTEAEVTAARAAHGYIQHLDTDTLDGLPLDGPIPELHHQVVIRERERVVAMPAGPAIGWPPPPSPESDVVAAQTALALANVHEQFDAIRRRLQLTP